MGIINICFDKDVLRVDNQVRIVVVDTEIDLAMHKHIDKHHAPDKQEFSTLEGSIFGTQKPEKVDFGPEGREAWEARQKKVFAWLLANSRRVDPEAGKEVVTKVMTADHAPDKPGFTTIKGEMGRGDGINKTQTYKDALMLIARKRECSHSQESAVIASKALNEVANAEREKHIPHPLNGVIPTPIYNYVQESTHDHIEKHHGKDFKVEGYTISVSEDEKDTVIVIQDLRETIALVNKFAEDDTAKYMNLQLHIRKEASNG